MRLTIVDKQMAVVEDVFQVAAVTPETFAQIAELAAIRYGNAGFRWFVTPAGEVPRHAHPEDFGRIY